MLTLLSKISDLVYRLRSRRVRRILIDMYPDAEDRAMALLGMGAEELEIIATGQGWVIGLVEIAPDQETGEGYMIGIMDTEEVSSDLE